ncbi:glutamate carboxypeptidase II [Neokomagataea thailandica NBRC 106555]|uniref:M28 family peptidase n=2 Tax=Neokomagataea TaxID=1223423 RepID=A0A4Y6V7A9_9PROT|nr:MULTISPECIES: M28 family peptidase [Neokomagataea]QDH25264.1 M28 family peptidase [Neokomagataea tanensis]GBR54268.1 glutamate carboxypeptidase II [Neokomagataea thailandica NBRC 106555]
MRKSFLYLENKYSRLNKRTIYAVLVTLSLWPSTNIFAQTKNNEPQSVYGFLSTHTQDILYREQQFDKNIDRNQIDKWLKQLTSAPNHLGSSHDLENAQFIAKCLKGWGFDVKIERFKALVSYPIEQKLELVEPNKQSIDLSEPPIPSDPTTSITQGTIPGTEAYSPDGDVTAPLVYVNQGVEADYENLARLNISVKNKIVIVRSTGSGRMFKPLLAEKYGAVGTIIYSDPIEDGYTKGDVYPTGAWRPARGVQRGTLIVKDALDPALGNALIHNKHPENLNGPVLALSYASAKPLLAALTGPIGPRNWQGGLPITYHVGGTDGTKVHIRTRSDWSWRTLYNVIGTMTGTEHPDQYVIRGVHHDAWVFGAWDPLANTSAMLAEAQAIGALHRKGWSPKRTIEFASWDGEELSLLGSRWHVEQNPDAVANQTVFYLNGDTTSRGYLSVGGSPAMSTLLNQVSSSIIDPETGVTLSKRLAAKQAYDAAQRQPLLATLESNTLLPPLQSGSDFSSFVHKLGVMSMHTRFGYDRDGDEESVPIYHSAYDTYAHYQRFGDPGMAYLQTLADLDGHLLLRVADADILPWHYTELATAMDSYVTSLEQENSHQTQAARQRTRLLALDAYRLEADPSRHLGNPTELLPGIENLDTSPLRKAIAQFRSVAAEYDILYSQLETVHAGERLDQVNHHLAVLEQHFIQRDGKKSRTLLYANSGSPFPEIQKAIHASDKNASILAVQDAATAVMAASDELKSANDALKAFTTK